MESESIAISRGTQQGDRFIIAAVHLRAPVFEWRKTLNLGGEKGFGIKMGEDKGSYISHLRFADDVLLLANSLSQLRAMTDFEGSTEKTRSENPPRRHKNTHQLGIEQTKRK